MINFFCFFVLKICLQNIHNPLNIIPSLKQNECPNNIGLVLILLLILYILLYLLQHLVILNFNSMAPQLKHINHALIIKNKIDPQNIHIWNVEFVLNIFLKKYPFWLGCDVINVPSNVDVQFIFEHLFKF